MRPRIKVSLRQTPGDDRFLARWEELGDIVDDDADCDVLILDHKTEVKKFPMSLKLVASPNTGDTHLKPFKIMRPEVELITLKGHPKLHEITSVAEHVFNLLFRMCRPLDGFGVELRGKKMGVVGMGRIGSQIEVIAEGFRMPTIFNDVKKEYKSDLCFAELECVMENSDVVTVHIPEEGNEGLLNKEMIDLMKPTAYLINTSRASVVDGRHAEGKVMRETLAGFADDFGNTVSCQGSPVQQSTHIAGSTREARIFTDDLLAEKVKDWIQSL